MKTFFYVTSNLRAQDVLQRARKEKVGNDQNSGCSTPRRCSGAPDADSSALGTEAFVAGDGANDQSKANRLDDAANNIIGGYAVSNRSKKFIYRKSVKGSRSNAAPTDTHHVRHHRQQRQRYD